ncbi:hypothetical protein CPB84DRAFT_1817309 [Gymnopilus junonius]|uniref:CxC2-like cysteine cluster KDZ transposase-associated domain-containing protein n=1 Tax=Gymnopilus junonius TaxID=109634 RepID=A0A9P5NE07_GYMJU|nr:hypothetical protein CPB84DRAFT_1817309 [Gymnopilus junonius]
MSHCLSGSSAEYRCHDCDRMDLVYWECLLALHEQCGLHCPEVWDASDHFFKCISLMSLGHHFQLGHPLGESCSSPVPAFGGSFTIVDLNGIHTVDIWFCNSTVKFPQTAITFCLLQFFQILSFKLKSTIFEFHKTLSRLTDNTGMETLKIGINLQAGWENMPKVKQFLYGLFISLDANFHLKQKIVSSHAADPGLSKGWAYFVKEDQFKDFLHKFRTLIIQEPSKCSNHNAVNREHTMEGYAASGVTSCDCTHHDMKRPNGICDMQKGEWYLNMDFIFLLSILLHLTILYITVSYDIACQWSIKLWEHMKVYPDYLKLMQALYVIHFLIPKFHLPTHILLCQIIYSLNYNKDLMSTHEMGPGAHHDTLDAHFGDWNW